MKLIDRFVSRELIVNVLFTIPWGLLTAILLVFGRLSADNELIALGSNGVSVTSVCLPLLVLAIIPLRYAFGSTWMWRPPRKKNCGAQSLISQRVIRSPNRDWSLNAEGIYQHVSNANTSDRNVGLNALVGLLGFSRAF